MGRWERHTIKWERGCGFYNGDMNHIPNMLIELDRAFFRFLDCEMEIWGWEGGGNITISKKILKKIQKIILIIVALFRNIRVTPLPKSQTYSESTVYCQNQSKIVSLSRSSENL